MTSISKERIAEIKALVAQDPTHVGRLEYRQALAELFAALEAATEWKVIAGAELKGQALLYWPKQTISSRTILPAMMRVDTFNCAPNRRPSHYMPLPAPPSTEGER